MFYCLESGIIHENSLLETKMFLFKYLYLITVQLEYKKVSQILESSA